MLPNISNNSFWKLCTGTYGMRVKRKMIPGNSARKKLKATEEALAFRAPLYIPLKNRIPTSCMGAPSKARGVHRLDKAMKDLTILRFLNMASVLFTFFYLSGFKTQIQTFIRMCKSTRRYKIYSANSNISYIF